MKKLIKFFAVVLSVLTVGGIIAGYIDRVKIRKEKKRGLVHKECGIYEKYFKRTLDFILSGAAMIGLSPIMLILTIVVRRKLGSPVIFKQERIGRNNKRFYLYKYRSMTDDKDENGELLDDSVRLTPFGRKLRSSSLDELPELWNILKGDLSIVGPRPLPTEYLPYYNDTEIHRHDVLPGLTGLAQANGRTALAWDKRFAYDVEYVKKITLLGDVKIIFGTIRKVYSRSDIVEAGCQGNFSDFRENQWKLEKFDTEQAFKKGMKRLY